MHPQSHTPYSPDRATVADDCLSAFNESKLDKRSKFETIETIDCRVQAGHWLSCPKTNARTPYTTFSTTLAVARARELSVKSFPHVVSRHRTSPLEDGVCFLEGRLETRHGRYCRRYPGNGLFWGRVRLRVGAWRQEGWLLLGLQVLSAVTALNTAQ